MLRYQHIADNEKKLLAMTSLTQQEFEDFVPIFTASFLTYLEDQTIEGYERIGKPYRTYKNSPLPTFEDKLLFILVYLKQHPTQEVQGQLFGMSQSNANKWIHLLHAVLNRALATAGYLPQRIATIVGNESDDEDGDVSDEHPLFFTMVSNAPSIDQAIPTSNGSTIVERKSSIR
jgi:hypothetical protein